MPMAPTKHRPSLNLYLLALMVGTMLLAGIAGFRLSQRAGMQAMQVEANHRLDLFTAAIDSVVNQYTHVPGLIELNDEVLQLLAQPGDKKVANKTNRYLEKLNNRISSIAIFILDTRGMTLAASNWQRSDSFVGDNYAFRPYFQMAMRGKEGSYYAIGTSRGDPGYFVSQPIREHGRIVGVAVIKIGLSRLENSWLPLGSPVLIADDNGVVILSSVLGWKFTAVTPLSAEKLAEIERTRQYNQQPIGAFPLDIAAGVDSDTAQVIAIDKPMLSQSGAPYGAGKFLLQARPLTETGWKLLLFSDLKSVRNQAVSHGALAAVVAGFIMLLLLLLQQRQRNFRQKLEAQAMLKKANAELEEKVETRTADLTAANERLRGEISERERAEQTLRSAQDELVQAGKLAVLGQMATGITHELTQPLGAMRTLAGNAIEFMRRGDMATLEKNLDIIGKLVDQMGAIIVPLKTFARKSPAHPQAVDVAHALGSALFLLDQRLRRDAITLDNRCQPGIAIAWCDQNRLEQVLINLIGNAIDAMSDQVRRVLTLSVRHEGEERILISIADTGPGFSDKALAHLFEPFFTTKPVGEGLGLGLAISRDIVSDFGGSLSASNKSQGQGAVFTIDLPAAKEKP
jgi:two-component system C4-dicarboxylate transport sensor histidine kinase DctB